MTERTGGRVAIGSSVPRVDGIDKVTGRALYVDDLTEEGMLHGVTVRSSVAHGILKSIDLDPDFDWTGITVVTADEIPGDNVITLIIDDQPALVAVGAKVMHIDEPVALVAAADRRRAQIAAEHVRLVIDELPPVFGIDDALEAKIALHGTDNVFKEFNLRKGEADIEEALAQCDVVIDGTYRTGAQEQMYIEPQGIIAQWIGDSCRITGSLQCPYYVHKAMKPLLDLPEDKVIVAQAVTGGGFGGKEEYPSMISAHAALLAKKAGAPVKIIYDRDEDIAATTKRHPALVHHRLGLDNDGTVRVVDVDVVIDAGAYVTLSPVVLSRAVLHAAGPYKCDQVRIRGRAMATNTQPFGAFRGFGAPQTTFAYERQMQKAAAQLGIEPFEIRRKNMLCPGDTTATGQLLEISVGSEAVIDAVHAVAGAAPERQDGSVRRGRGVAFYFHGAGFTGSGEERLAARATVALQADGTFEVRASSTDIGQGAITMFSQICASALGVPIDCVTVAEASTDRVPDSGPTVASRTCMVVGGVLERASFALRERIEAWAGKNGRGEEALESAARAMATDVGELAETAQYKPPEGIQWDDETYTGSAYPAYGWACCLVDVAVDVDTYEVTVERCVHAVDVGKAINPIIVKGQIEGGTLQALGWALLEWVSYDEGRVRNASMTDCIVPTSADAPEMETIVVEEPYTDGPHGAKGVGEIPMDGPGAAAIGAVVNALGIELDRVPALPEDIEQALAAGGAS